MSKPRNAFALIELIVVAAIIVLLIALIVPAILRVRGSADGIGCQNNMRQIAIALQHYHNDYGHLPPSVSARRVRGDPNELLSWRALILPYIERDDLWQKALQDCIVERISYKPPHTGYHTVVKLYYCPTDSSRLSVPQVFEDKETAFSSYLGVRGTYALNGMFPDNGSMGVAFGSATDGLSNTLLVGERPPPDAFNAGQWYSEFAYGKNPFISGPDSSLFMMEGASYRDVECQGIYSFSRGETSNPCDRYHFWSLHSQGANFVFADCSTRFIKYSVDFKVMMALASRNGGEPVSLDE